jgi:hypothetical protein
MDSAHNFGKLSSEFREMVGTMVEEIIPLWTHQREAAMRAFKKGSWGFFMEQGTGKTLTTVYTLRNIYAEKKRLLRTIIFCPPVVRRAWEREFHKSSKIKQITVLDGAGKERLAKFKKIASQDGGHIFVTNYESLSMPTLFKELKAWAPEALVFDECFVAGTNIDTPTGARPIESLKPGDYVLNACGVSRIRHVFKKKVLGRVRVSFAGKIVTCSPNHLWLTKSGWVKARDLSEGDSLVETKEALRVVRSRASKEEWQSGEVLLSRVLSEMESSAAGDTRKNIGGFIQTAALMPGMQGKTSDKRTESFLWSILQREMENATARREGQGIHEGNGCEMLPRTFREAASRLVRGDALAEPHVSKGGSRESIQAFAGKGVGAYTARGEWTRPHSSRETPFSRASRGVVVEPCCWTGAQNTGVSNDLQSRPCLSTKEVGYRSRRELPLLQKITGREENEEAGFVRVDRVEVMEQGHLEGLGSGYLYDLEVSGHPSFSVEGVLVHNSQRCKEIKAKRTKLAIELADTARHKFILTGTPILNTPMDIWAQFRILDGGETFDRNFYAFRARYFYDKNANMPAHIRFPAWEPLPGLDKVFHEKIYAKASRVLKKDCLDLPPIVRQRLDVELSDEQRRLYDTMKKDFIAFLDDKACVARTALTKGLRLQQLVSGIFSDEDGGEHALKSNPRLNALSDCLESIHTEHKSIVWVSFRRSYDECLSVCRDLGVNAVTLVGGMTDKARQEAIDSFQNDPSVRVMIANPAAGGVGVTLTAASYMIYYSRDFSLENDLQSEARCHRGGSEAHEKITRIDIVAPGTIDEVILEALERKENLATKILAIREKL